MKLWIFSDLHLAFAGVETPIRIPAADVCVVPGDIHVKGPDRSVRWLAENVAGHMPVVFVCGNHEFYHSSLQDGLAAGRAAAAPEPNIHLLENDAIEISGVRFAGCTLWTDFELMGHRPFAMQYAEMTLSDYHEIRLTGRSGRRIRATNTVRMHRDSRRFIADFLGQSDLGPAVVVSHHAPSRRSISHHYATDLLSSAFASDMDALIVERGPALWVHGHLHQRQNYMLGNTRVLCNPRGYPDEEGFRDFDFSMVVEI